MRFIVQRVQQASVEVDGRVVGEIGKGFLVFVGISALDTAEIAAKMISKLIRLRIFEDSEGKTNLNLETVNGSLLIISQFYSEKMRRNGSGGSTRDFWCRNEGFPSQ